MVPGKESPVAIGLNLLYLVLLFFMLPWFLWKWLRIGKYREGMWTRLTGNVPLRRGSEDCIWLHAVSVGEVNLLASLIEELEQEHPECECVISTTTNTGYTLACKKYAPRLVFYCPLDFSWAVRNSLRRIRPSVLLLAELELWPNLIRIASQQGVRVAVVNGRLSETSFRGYMRWSWLFRVLLRRLDFIAVQNHEYADRFRRLGGEDAQVHVTGSLKFDGAQADRDNPATCQLAKLAGFVPEDIVFLAGSTQEPEEQLALRTYQELADAHEQLRLVLVPRHPERFDAVAGLLNESGLPWRRRSELTGDDGRIRILLVDTVGELGAWWGTAQIAFVGGSMGSRGGQNMIEPAAYGAAVCFGPHTSNFRHVVEVMLSAGAAKVVRDGPELTRFVRRAIEDPEFLRQHGQAAQQLVADQLGATSKTVKLLAAPHDLSGELFRADRGHELTVKSRETPHSQRPF